MDRKDHIRFAIDWFVYHADQRIKTFKFHILINGALLALLVSLLIKKYHIISLLLSIVVIWTSFLFMRLDKRNSDLVKISEKVIQEWECENGYNGIILEADNKAKKADKLYGFYSYSKIFKSIFITYILMGFCILLYSFATIMNDYYIQYECLPKNIEYRAQNK